MAMTIDADALRKALDELQAKLDAYNDAIPVWEESSDGVRSLPEAELQMGKYNGARLVLARAARTQLPSVIAAARAHLATLEPHDWQPALYEDGEPAPFNQCARCKQVSYAPVIAPCSAHLATLEGGRRHTVEEIRDCWLRNRGADGSDWESALTAVYDLALAARDHLATLESAAKKSGRAPYHEVTMSECALCAIGEPLPHSATPPAPVEARGVEESRPMASQEAESMMDLIFAGTGYVKAAPVEARGERRPATEEEILAAIFLDKRQRPSRQNQPALIEAVVNDWRIAERHHGITDDEKGGG